MSPHPRILILDDEEGPRTAIQMILDRDGMDCALAASSEEAISLAQSEKFAVIISDIAHPGLRGLDLIPIWKQLQPNVPIIIVSAGLGLEGVEQRAMALGASICLNKPFKASEICDAVQSVLPARPNS